MIHAQSHHRKKYFGVDWICLFAWHNTTINRGGLGFAKGWGVPNNLPGYSNRWKYRQINISVAIEEACSHNIVEQPTGGGGWDLQKVELYQTIYRYQGMQIDANTGRMFFHFPAPPTADWWRVSLLFLYPLLWMSMIEIKQIIILANMQFGHSGLKWLSCLAKCETQLMQPTTSARSTIYKQTATNETMNRVCFVSIALYLYLYLLFACCYQLNLPTTITRMYFWYTVQRLLCFVELEQMINTCYK